MAVIVVAVIEKCFDVVPEIFFVFQCLRILVVDFGPGNGGFVGTGFVRQGYLAGVGGVTD